MEEVARAISTTITVGGIDPARPVVKPLLDLNAGHNVNEVASRYKSVGVRRLRTHDYDAALDVGNIYRNLSADPRSSSSYNFSAADKAFASIVDAGFEPYFRLGNSGGQQPGSTWRPDSWGAPNATSQLPNIVEAMVRIATRYTDASLWKRPAVYVDGCTSTDNRTKHWPLFEDLFVRAVGALKSALPPHVKVGGPGFGVGSYCTPDPATGRMRLGGQGVDLLPFFDRLVRNATPLDFFSWHRYSDDPARMAECGSALRSAIPSSWELVVSEWNLQTSLNTTVAAARATAIWVSAMQDHADLSLLYWGCCASFPYTSTIQPGDGVALFARQAARPWKPMASAFAMWHNASSFGDRLATRVSPSASPLVALAGARSTANGRPLSPRLPSGAACALLLSNPSNLTASVAVSFSERRHPCEPAACRRYALIDETGQVHSSVLQAADLPRVVVRPWETTLIVDLNEG
jgi:hypothetical protein